MSCSRPTSCFEEFCHETHRFLNVGSWMGNRPRLHVPAGVDETANNLCGCRSRRGNHRTAAACALSYGLGGRNGVTNLPAPMLSEGASVVCVFCIFLVPLAAGGLALLNAGLGRSRSAAHTMIASVCILSVAPIVYFVCGFAVQGFSGAGKPYSESRRTAVGLDRRRPIFSSQIRA